MTLDLETKTLSDGSLRIQVISSCIYDGIDYITYYISDYPTGSSEFNYKAASKKLIKATINKLIDPKFNKHYCYVHNLSNFDIIFLFKGLLNLKDLGYTVEFTKREDKFISFSISKYIFKTVKGNIIKSLEFKLVIYDSLLLLPHSLSDLAKAFNVGARARHSLETISIDISYVKKNKRYYLFMLKSSFKSEDDIRQIVFFIEDACIAKGIELEVIDRLFVRLSIVKHDL